MPKQTAFVLRVEREDLCLPIDAAYPAFFAERLRDGVKVAFDIGRPDGDTREAFEDPEVRAWMQAFFILAMPEALAALAPGARGRGLVEACCSEVRRRGATLCISTSGAWLDACRQAGIQPAGEWSN